MAQVAAAQMEQMLEISGDCWACEPRPGLVPFRVAPDDMDRLRDSGLEFEVWLPLESFNGRLVAFGNGGMAGSISYGGMSIAITQGSGVFSTDTGHTVTAAGAIEAVTDRHLRDLLLIQLEDVDSWSRFLATRLALDVARLVPADERARLEALPAMVRLRGDAVPIEYEVEQGMGVARIWLREGQARRLTEDELPVLDRPLRFGVRRQGEPPVRAATLRELTRLLREEIRRGKGMRADRNGGGRRRPGPRRRRN